MKRILLPILLLLMTISSIAIVHGQDDGQQSDCDEASIIATYEGYQSLLADLPTQLENNRDDALSTIYTVGLSLQSLAVECGFDPATLEFVAAEEGHRHTDHLTPEQITELIRSIGNPENGEALFTTFQAQAGFACNNCHYTNSLDTLIGPGLQQVGDPAYIHDTYKVAEEDDHDHDDTMTDAEKDIDAIMDQVLYIRTSIMAPSSFVVPGFANYVMPQNYVEVFTEEEINDIVAFLLQNSLQPDR